MPKSHAISLKMSRHQHLKVMMMILLGLMLVSSLSACGKRGDPYKPSEVSISASTS